MSVLNITPILSLKILLKLNKLKKFDDIINNDVVDITAIHVFFFEDALGKTTIQLESLHQTTQSIDSLGNYWRFDISEVQMLLLSFVRFWFVKMIPLEVWVKNVKDADRLQTDEEGMKLIQKKMQFSEDQPLKHHLFTSSRDKVKMELELVIIEWLP